MTRPHPVIKSARHAFPGHSLVRHGPGDWRCKCGVPLKSWKFIDGTSEDWPERVEMTGRDGARQAMVLHRAALWLSWNAS